MGCPHRQGIGHEVDGAHLPTASPVAPPGWRLDCSKLWGMNYYPSMIIALGTFSTIRPPPSKRGRISLHPAKNDLWSQDHSIAALVHQAELDDALRVLGASFIRGRRDGLSQAGHCPGGTRPAGRCRLGFTVFCRLGLHRRNKLLTKIGTPVAKRPCARPMSKRHPMSKRLVNMHADCPSRMIGM